jgi:hypothetical protein
MAGGYGLSVSGWATVAPPTETQPPVVLPFAALGKLTIEQDGAGSGQVTQVLAGQAFPLDDVTLTMKMSVDCKVTFVANCSGGCHWEGTGTFYRSTRQMDLLFTKVGAGQIPVTGIATLKPF